MFFFNKINKEEQFLKTFLYSRCFLGYASALDIDWLETIALETLGFKICSGGDTRAPLRNSMEIVNKLVRKSSPGARRLFATRLRDQHDSSVLIRDRVRTVGIKRTVTPGDPLNDRDILSMVVTFLTRLRTYVFRSCVIKRFLLHNLCKRVRRACETVASGSRFPRQQSRCILHNLRYGLERLVAEVFLLR